MGVGGGAACGPLSAKGLLACDVGPALVETSGQRWPDGQDNVGPTLASDVGPA